MIVIKYNRNLIKLNESLLHSKHVIPSNLVKYLKMISWNETCEFKFKHNKSIRG